MTGTLHSTSKSCGSLRRSVLLAGNGPSERVVAYSERAVSGGPGDRSREVLVLYRKRTGAMLLRNGVYSHAGSLLIQRLEGSLCGIFELWVLNCAKRGESWRAGWWIVIGWLNWPPGPVFPEIYSRTPGNAGTRVAMVLEPVLRS
jgi:hypothetical protein